jgi:hypothetical protein
MMKSISICILEKDAQYLKAFMSVVAADHAGYTVKARSVCDGDCGEDVDACIRFEPCVGGSQGSCGKAIQPVCGRYAGVGAILREAKTFALDRGAGNVIAGGAVQRYAEPPGLQQKFEQGALICVHALAGGVGTSFTAIGIGRELSRYRGECVLYLSIEDVENLGLYPEGAGALRAEETLYRYFKLSGRSADPEEFGRLCLAAAARDEYGLYRFAPDEGLCSFAGLSCGDLYIFLRRISASLGLTRIVLDFGTRLHFLSEFTSIAEDGEAILFKVEEAAFSRYEEDTCGLTNVFGKEIKEICDSFTGEKL